MLNFYRFIVIFLLSATASAQLNPNALIIPSSTVNCTGSPVSFTVSSPQPLQSYTWSVLPDKDVILSSKSASILTATFPKEQTYTISVTVRSGELFHSGKRLLSVSRNPIAAFNASLTEAGYPTELVLTNFSQNSVTNYWRFSGQAIADTAFNLRKTFTGKGSHTVTLISVGRRGCNDSTSYSFRIADSSSLVLPNIFSPDRDDVNEVFKPITTGMKALSGWIFTREGQLLYHWNTVNGFWDGRTSSGEMCVNGQYVAIIEAVGFDGKNYKQKTHITLVR